MVKFNTTTANKLFSLWLAKYRELEKIQTEIQEVEQRIGELARPESRVIKPKVQKLDVDSPKLKEYFQEKY